MGAAGFWAEQLDLISVRAVAPASVKVQLFARDSERITLEVKSGSYGVLVHVVLPRGTNR